MSIFFIATIFLPCAPPTAQLYINISRWKNNKIFFSGIFNTCHFSGTYAGFHFGALPFKRDVTNP